MNRRKFFPALIGLPLVTKALPKMIQRKGKECPCDSCGKEQHNFEKNQDFIGIAMQVFAEDKHSKRMLGKYKLKKQYNVCWECWLKSLGVKP